MKPKSQYKTMTNGAWSLWLNWALPFIFVILILVTASITSNAITALITISTVGLTHFIIFRNRQNESPYCLIIPYMLEIAFFWLAVIIFILDIIGDKLLTELSGQPYNHNLSIMPIMFFAPLCIIVSLWIKIKKRKCAFCQDCIARLGKTSDRSLLGKIYYQEAVLQTNVIFSISVVLTIVEWWYYFSYYVNTNYNSLDNYFYIWLPVTFICATMIFFGLRYYSLRKFLCSDDCNTSTIIRFLIIKQDQICISEDKNNVYDTPYKTSVSFQRNVTDIKAIEIFEKLSGISNGTIKFLYQSSDYRTISNVVHFAVFLQETEAIHVPDDKIQWATIEQLKTLTDHKTLSRSLMSEINRIYTIAISWKTYDAEGKRRYKVKYYTPTFRLSDMKSWEVDYNEPLWLYVSKINEDKKFYKLRMFWHKYISGFIKK